MKPRSNFLLIGLLLIALALGLIWEMFPLKSAVDRINNIPLKNNYFAGRNIKFGYGAEEPVLVVVHPLDLKTVEWNSLSMEFFPMLGI